MIKAGIVGGTGYTGVELLRLLSMHPDAEVVCVTSRSEAGMPVADMFPSLRGHLDVNFTAPDADSFRDCDVVFFATPHGVAHALAEDVLAGGARVIDLSADFRLRDADEWAHWYGQPHGAPALLEQAVYGLPEMFRDEIGEARLVAVPGCYPTSVQLGLMPLMEQKLVDVSSIIADCKSGVSGAGRGAKVGSLLCEAGESMSAYGVAGHRHLPEIRQGLQDMCGEPVGLTFVPHLTPMIRGIHSTLYVTLNTAVDVQALYQQRYADEYFVDVMPPGSHPQTRSVRGANFCRLAVHALDEKRLVVLSVIDNLVKGASGQAIQNMNLMFDLPEHAGLDHPGMQP